MESHAWRGSGGVGLTGRTTVCIERNRRGGWDVELSDRHERARCETLDDARRVAYPCGAHARPCELIVRDADQRVLYHEPIDADLAAARSRSSVCGPVGGPRRVR